MFFNDLWINDNKGIKIKRMLATHSFFCYLAGLLNFDISSGLVWNGWFSWNGVFDVLEFIEKERKTEQRKVFWVIYRDVSE